jgi:hypothetical protein
MIAPISRAISPARANSGVGRSKRQDHLSERKTFMAQIVTRTAFDRLRDNEQWLEGLHESRVHYWPADGTLA